MGGIAGKPNVLEVDAINKIVNQSVLKLSATTKSKNDVTQNIEASGGSVVSGNKQYVDVKSNMSSVLTAMQSSDFKPVVKSDVAQELDKKSVALIGAFDGLLQNNGVEIKTKIGSSIENLNLTEFASVCAMDNTLTQNIIAKSGSVITDNSQTIKADFVQSCTSMVDSNMSTMSDIANSFNQKAAITSENPLNALRDMVTGSMGYMVFIIAAIIIGFTIMVGPGKLDVNKLAEQAGNIAKSSGPGKLLPR